MAAVEETDTMSSKRGDGAGAESAAATETATTPAHPQARMVTVYIMGKRAVVPEHATIMRAIEYTGQQIIRGAGCREGFCGACGTLYRLPGDYRIHTGLACTTLVKEGMSLTQIPAVPMEKAIYDLEQLEPTVDTIKKYYPAIFRCVSCNTCTKTCPQGLQVMDYVNAAMRGDVAEVMDLSFDCVSCGLCALRCPAEIVQHKVGILCRRLYGRYLRKESKELDLRLAQIRNGDYDAEYAEMMAMAKAALSEKYYARDVEA
jgi:heterodisulfide reductase subunit C